MNVRTGAVAPASGERRASTNQYLIPGQGRQQGRGSSVKYQIGRLWEFVDPGDVVTPPDFLSSIVHQPTARIYPDGGHGRHRVEMEKSPSSAKPSDFQATRALLSWGMFRPMLKLASVSAAD